MEASPHSERARYSRRGMPISPRVSRAATVLPRNRRRSASNGALHPLRCCILMGVASFRRRIGPGHPQRIPQPDQALTVLTEPVRPVSPALDQGTCPSWILSSLPSPARRHGFCAPPRPSVGRPPSWPGAPRAHRLLSHVLGHVAVSCVLAWLVGASHVTHALEERGAQPPDFLRRRGARSHSIQSLAQPPLML